MSLVLGASAPAWGADLYGLTIGIDDYEGIVNDLDGAVNDAKDVSQALESAGARKVVRLFNDDASKDAITSAWETLVAEAKPGDTIVFSYAGHGGQEPAPPSRHDKTTIESFLLGHFKPSGPGTPSSTTRCSLGCRRLTRKASRSFSLPIPVILAAWSGARARLASSSVA
jgi:uncharacterized protein YndB with AHSA1/START domain